MLLYPIAELPEAGLEMLATRRLQGLSKLAAPRVLAYRGGLVEVGVEGLRSGASLHPVPRALSSLAESRLEIQDVIEHLGLGVEALVVRAIHPRWGELNVAVLRGLKPYRHL